MPEVGKEEKKDQRFLFDIPLKYVPRGFSGEADAL